MTKLILIILTFGILATPIMAWHIDKTVKSGHKQYTHYIYCNNGNVIPVVENKSTNNFFVGSSMYGNINEAVKRNCNLKKSSKIVTLKHEALVCKTRKQMKQVLSSERSYKFWKTVSEINGGDKEECILTRKAKVKLLKKYSNETVDIEKQNGKREWIETKKVIDSYYLIKAGDKKYYVRSADIIW